MTDFAIKHHLGETLVQTLDQPNALQGFRSGDIIVTDQNVAQAFAETLRSHDPIVLPPGEETKSIQSYGELVQELARRGTRRDATLFALGGGVIGDLAGFAAASYMRGIRLVMIPTSLLAMVDSSVGGKVGIDLPAGKNLVGAFYPPAEVRLIRGALETLPVRHWHNGMAEVWKYGYIMDPELLISLRQNLPQRKAQNALTLATRCIQDKAAIVEEDEFETTGRRAILNFGHTIGHAIEKVLNYQTLLHGEAIAIGMVAEAKLGETLGLTPKGMAEAIRGDLQSSHLPTSLPPAIDPESLTEAMKIDKKADRQGLSFSLLTGEGACTIVRGLTEETVLQSLKQK